MRLDSAKGAPVRYPAIVPSTAGHAAPLMGELRATPSVIAALAGTRDPQLAAVFRQMRAVSGLNEAQLARQLGTDISVVMDLESGAVDSLPSWPETVRIVSRYSNIAHIDTRPLLARLMQLQRRETPITAPPRALVPFSVPAPGSIAQVPVTATYTAQHAAARVPTRRDGPTVRARAAATDVLDEDGEEELSVEEAAAARRLRRRRRTRAIAAAVTPLLMLVAVLIVAQSAPRQLYALTAPLPRVLQTPIKGVVDFAVWQSAPVVDGLRWVDAGDPRLRKADRLAGK